MNNRNKNAQSFNLNELRKKTGSDLREAALSDGLGMEQIDFKVATEIPSYWPSSQYSCSPSAIFKKLRDNALYQHHLSPIDEISMIGEFDDECLFDKAELIKAIATYYDLLSQLSAQEEPQLKSMTKKPR